MAFLAASLDRVKPSATIAVSQKARELKAQGMDVIGWAPASRTSTRPTTSSRRPSRPLRAARPSTPRSRASRSCARRSRRSSSARTGSTTSPSRRSSRRTGGKHVLFNAFMATLNPGDESSSPRPTGSAIPDGLALRRHARRRPDAPGDSFKLTAEALERAITPKTKWFLFNSPSNPTGAAYTHAELKALTDVLMRHEHVWVMTDDMYEHLVYGDFTFATPRRSSRRCTSARSRSTASPRPMHDRLAHRLCRRTAEAHQGDGHDPGPADVRRLLDRAVGGGRGAERHPGLHSEDRAVFEKRRDLVVSMLNQASGIECPSPEGAFYVYPSVAGTIGAKTQKGKVIETDEDFVTALLEQEGVAVVHGTAAFGLGPNFRLSYATSDALLEEACTRIQRFCGSLQR